MVSLIQVLRRQEDVGAGPTHLAHGVPHLVAAAGIQPCSGLVEQKKPGRSDEARSEVEATTHPARIGPDVAVGGLNQIHLLEDALGAFLGRLGGHPVEAGHHGQVFAARHDLLDGGGLSGQPDHLTHGHRMAHDVMAVDPQCAVVGLGERRHHAEEGGLPSAVGSQDGHRLAGRQGE